MYVYDVITGDIVSKLSGGHSATIRDVSWHPYLPQMCSSSWDGSHVLWGVGASETDMDEPDSDVLDDY